MWCLGYRDVRAARVAVCGGRGLGPPMTTSRLIRYSRDKGLTLAFLFQLLLALVGQAVSGVAEFNHQQTIDGAQQVSLWQYVTSSSFAVDVAENWQSEYLQFALYILATIWLVQRGSSESKRLEDVGTQSDKDQKVGRYATPSSPACARAGGLARRAVRPVVGNGHGDLLPALTHRPVHRRTSRLQRRSPSSTPGPGQLG